MGIFQLIYYIGHLIKSRLDLRKQKRLPHRVISVGNITTGGTGKTPMTMSLAEEAQKRGYKPIILTRGYRGKAEGPVVVSPEMSADDVGDEPLLMSRRLSGVPVIKCADRYKAGMYAANNLDLGSDTLFILDDGFQHRKLYRDLDILLINAMDPFDNGKLLPVGHLRGPLSEMKRAGIIVLTNALNSDSDKLIAEIRKYNKTAPVFRAGQQILSIMALSGEQHPREWLSGKKIFAFCAIGEPDSFMESLKASGAQLVGFMSFRDHHRYGQADIEKIEKKAAKGRADWIITTEKDIMKLEKLKLPGNLVFSRSESAAEGAFFNEVFRI